MRIELLDIQRCQHFMTFRPCGNRQLMLGQVRQLAVQSIMAAWPQPLRGVLAVTLLRPQIQLDRQFQVMHAVTISHQHVQLAQRVPRAADRQVGSDQLYPWRMLYRKLPQPLVIEAQAPGARLAQPVLQNAAVLIECS